MCEWKTIEGFEDYEISSDGQVYSHLSNRIIKSRGNGRGYLVIDLYSDHKRHTRLVHRLVAGAFIPNPDDLPQINHKDENKTNNCVSNLEWCSAQYNNNYGTHNERSAQGRQKPIAAYSKSGELVAEYPSVSAAAEAMRITNTAICNCLKGRQKTASGYIWKYI